MWDSIRELVTMLLVSIHPFLVFSYECQFEGGDTAKCFQIIGIDILLDERLKPWLLEINGNPSMNIEHSIDPENPESEKEVSPVDIFIKEKVMEGALEIVQMPHDKQQNICAVYKEWETLPVKGTV